MPLWTTLYYNIKYLLKWKVKFHFSGKHLNKSNINLSQEHNYVSITIQAKNQKSITYNFQLINDSINKKQDTCLTDSDMALLELLKSLSTEMKEQLLKQTL